MQTLPLLTLIDVSAKLSISVNSGTITVEEVWGKIAHQGENVPSLPFSGIELHPSN